MTHKRIRKNGFTLIELLVAVAIVGILAAIAIPSYQESMRKSRRSDAQGALMSFANAMERYYTQFNTYCGIGTTGLALPAVVASETCVGGRGAVADSGIPPGDIFVPRGETRVNYVFTITGTTANTFTLQAIPIPGSAQATDGIIELDSTGARRWDEANDGFTVPVSGMDDDWVKGPG